MKKFAETPEAVIEVSIKKRSRSVGDRPRAFSLSVSSPSLECLGLADHPGYKEPKDEAGIKAWNKEWRAYNKLELKIQRTGFNDEVSEIISEAIGRKIDLVNAQFSRYAGCSCPCSPGFILRDEDKKRIKEPYNTTYSIWITIHLKTAENKALLTDKLAHTAKELAENEAGVEVLRDRLVEDLPIETLEEVVKEMKASIHRQKHFVELIDATEAILAKL